MSGAADDLFPKPEPSPRMDRDRVLEYLHTLAGSAEDAMWKGSDHKSMYEGYLAEAQHIGRELTSGWETARDGGRPGAAAIYHALLHTPGHADLTPSPQPHHKL